MGQPVAPLVVPFVGPLVVPFVGQPLAEQRIAGPLAEQRIAGPLAEQRIAGPFVGPRDLPRSLLSWAVVAARVQAPGPVGPVDWPGRDYRSRGLVHSNRRVCWGLVPLKY